MQRIIRVVYLVRSSQEHLESYSVPANQVGEAVPTVQQCMATIKRWQSPETPADVCFSTTFELSFSVSSLGQVVLVLLFKKGVGREIGVLEADNVFSNCQHSRNPLLKFWGRRNAGDLSQSTYVHSASRTFSWRLRLCSLKVNSTLLQLCGSRRWKLRSTHERSLRDFLASVAPKKNNACKRANQIFKSSCTNFAPWQEKLVEAPDSRTTGRISLYSWGRRTLV